jgi:TIGR02436 family protein
VRRENIVVDKSKAFALRVIKLYKYLCERKEFILSKQLLRSGTSIGANIKEAVRGQSKADFYAKLNIALKEASETEYWLELLYESDYIEKAAFESIYSDCQELIKLLVSITKTQKVSSIRNAELNGRKVRTNLKLKDGNFVGDLELKAKSQI